jgi:hypothetical protein
MGMEGEGWRDRLALKSKDDVRRVLGGDIRLRWFKHAHLCTRLSDGSGSRRQEEPRNDVGTCLDSRDKTTELS